jgi:Fic family protein
LKVSQGEPLYADQAAKDRLEARNARLQFRRVLELIPDSRGEPRERGYLLRLTPDIIKALHASALQDIYSCAGTFRNWRFSIISSPHQPPEPEFVPGLVEEMCEKANGDGDDWDAIQTAAYLLWRLNWIHPFGGGNGRTSRAVAYLALCVRLGFAPPGHPTIGEFILANRRRYIEALRDADEAWKVGALDVTVMVQLLGEMLEAQIAAATETRPES